MKGVIVAVLVLLLSQLMVQGQDFLSWQFNDRYFSVQVGTGSSTYFGDLKHDYHLRKSPSNVNLGVEARLLSRLSARVQVAYYHLKGTDAKANDSTYAQQRNLSFYGNNWEASLQGVYYFFKYQGDYFRRMRWDPYLFAGVGTTYFNPKTKLYGQELTLSELETEGVNYNQWALMVPVGLGIKFKINTFMNFNVEASYHFTTSDYLDDVSTSFPASYPDLTTELVANRKDEIEVVNQNAYDNILIEGGRRGNPDVKDTYLFINLQLEFFLPPDLFSRDGALFKKGSGH